MADKNVNTVTAATAVAAGDSLLVSKSNTTLQKIDYNLLAKAIIEQYTGSTLAGSAQSLQTAINALNSNAYITGGSGLIQLPTNTDLDLLKEPGNYICMSIADTRTMSNVPFDNSGFSLHIESISGGSRQYVFQTIKRLSNAPEIYIRGYNAGTSTWSNWQKLNSTTIT